MRAHNTSCSRHRPSRQDPRASFSPRHRCGSRHATGARLACGSTGTTSHGQPGHHRPHHRGAAPAVLSLVPGNRGDAALRRAGFTPAMPTVLPENALLGRCRRTGGAAGNPKRLQPHHQRRRVGQGVPQQLGQQPHAALAVGQQQLQEQPVLPSVPRGNVLQCRADQRIQLLEVGSLVVRRQPDVGALRRGVGAGAQRPAQYDARRYHTGRNALSRVIAHAQE